LVVGESLYFKAIEESKKECGGIYWRCPSTTK